MAPVVRRARVHADAHGTGLRTPIGPDVGPALGAWVRLTDQIALFFGEEVVGIALETAVGERQALASARVVGPALKTGVSDAARDRQQARVAF